MSEFACRWIAIVVHGLLFEKKVPLAMCAPMGHVRAHGRAVCVRARVYGATFCHSSRHALHVPSERIKKALREPCNPL